MSDPVAPEPVEFDTGDLTVRGDLYRNDVAMNWKYFIGSCVLATGLLLKAGAPLVPIALGIAAAAYFNWKRHQRTASATSKRQRGT